MSGARKYYGESMNNDQWECSQFIARLHGGFHHLNARIKTVGERGVCYNSRQSIFATYDFDGLTKAVIWAHEECIRFEVAPSGPGMVKLYAHKRQRSGCMTQRHPTLEDAIKKHSLKQQGPSK